MGMTVPDLEQRYESLRRDFMDLAQALGVEPSFQAVAQRVADLLNTERALKQGTPPVAQPGEL